MATVAASRPKSKEEIKRQRIQRASILFKQVSDPTRLQLVLMLDDGEAYVGALCEALGQGQPAVSHHISLMRHGGILEPRRQGKNIYYDLTDTGRELAKVVRGMVG